MMHTQSNMKLDELKTRQAIKCGKCGESLEGLVLLALFMDLGCGVHPSPLVCTDGKGHDFYTGEI